MRSSIEKLLPVLFLPLASMGMAGCGGMNVSLATPDFNLNAAPATLSLSNGAAPTTLTIAASAINGFNSSINLTVTGLPAGVTVTPATITTMPSQLQQVTFRAAGAPVTVASFTLTGTSGFLTHSTVVPLAVTAAPPPDFTLAITPNVLSITNGASTTISMTALPVNGLVSPVMVTPLDLPPGITASPAALTLNPGQPGQIILSALGAAAGTSTLTWSAVSGTVSKSVSNSLTVSPGLTTTSLSTLSFDFGGNLPGHTLTRPVGTITNTGPTPLSIAPKITGDPSYSLAPDQSCPAMLAPGASCSPNVTYVPTVVSKGIPQTATLNLGFGNVAPGTTQTIILTGQSAALLPGAVTRTNNPQVALYTMTLPFPGTVSVRFGLDTAYGHSTWSQSTTLPNQPVSLHVAGMIAARPYHLQATVQFANGLTVTDADHLFNTGNPGFLPLLTVSTTPGMTPQPGLEQLTFLQNAAISGVGITDLEGNLLWSYRLPGAGPALNVVEGVQLLPNGHFLLTICQTLNALSGVDPTPGVINSIREIDLAGNIVRELTNNDLTAELITAGYTVDPLIEFHHDITQLPNGHWLVLANALHAFTGLPGHPGVTNVLGDVIIDLDANLHPVWVWNAFDHLDVNRHPLQFPDWTHANAIVYSPSDGNLLYSLRNQNWVLKLAYQDGNGSGDVLWHLGEGGDFTLNNGSGPATDPSAWFYAQHYPTFFSQNTSGIFSLGLMDNGDNRHFAQGVTCNSPGAPSCLYSTVPVFQIDEGALTATLTSRQILPPNLYSNFGGSVDLLPNGNIEYDLCGVGTGSDIFEVTPDASAQTVWHMHSAYSNVYRGYRIPGLYPGVAW